VDRHHKLRQFRFVTLCTEEGENAESEGGRRRRGRRRVGVGFRCRCDRLCRSSSRRFFPFVHDLVYESPFLCLFSREPRISIEVAFNLLVRLRGVFHVDVVQHRFDPQYLLGGALHIACLTLRTRRRLVNHHERMGQGTTHSGFSGRQQQTRHTTRLSYTRRCHRRSNKLHRIVNSHSCRDMTTRRVNIHLNGRLRVFRIKKQQLRDRNSCCLIIDLQSQQKESVQRMFGEQHTKMSQQEDIQGHPSRQCDLSATLRRDQLHELVQSLVHAK